MPVNGILTFWRHFYYAVSKKLDVAKLNFNQTITSRQILFNTIKSNCFKVGNNLIVSKLSVLNNKIPLIDLNMLLASFKMKYREKMYQLHPKIINSVFKIFDFMPIAVYHLLLILSYFIIFNAQVIR